ncbi:MAG: HemK2/MTQ2 family protein methyltransferase [Promethearchaeota archaeon]
MISINFTVDPLIECNHDKIYYPSQDSFLIIDYFKKNINENYFDGIKLSEIENILDLGTGTGIIAIFLQLIKSQNQNFNPRIFASDILEEALICAKQNEILNSINNRITFLHSDLFKSFPDELKSSFNIIIFNPPYLPSSEYIEKNKNKQLIDYSWDGGLTGFEILLQFLKEAKDFLNLGKDHFIYCLSSSRIIIDNLIKKIIDLGYHNEILEKKHYFFEDIFLHRLKYLKY